MKKKLILLISFTLCKAVNAQNWTNGQNAVYALGATGTTASGTLNTTASTFAPGVAQTCFAIDSKHNCLYVADFFGNRVLRFAYPVVSNLPAANLVIGQSNFITSSSGGATQSGLYYPQGIAVDTSSGTLWVLSQGQNRVLRFDNAYTLTVNNPNANQVLGQPNFGSTSLATTQSGFNFNIGPQCGNLLHYDQLTGALWVSDNGNIRVLRFDNAKTLANGAPANAVLGQTVFTANTTSLSASKYGQPDGLTTIGTSLFVADADNNRVLRYDNVYTLANGAPATAVFGQAGFTSNTSGISASAFNNPSGLTSDQSNLYVADLYNSRIMIFNNALTNTVASNVLLAPNLTVAGTAALSPSTAGSCSGISYDPLYNELIIQDRANERALVFRSCNVMAITSASSVCNGSSIVLNGSGATSYTWNTLATTSSISVSPSVTTVYTFTGTTGACSSIVAQTIAVNPVPSLSVSSTSSFICSGQSATLTPSGALSYTWSSAPASTQIIVSPTASTSYTVSGTDANGCSNSTSFTQNASDCTGLSESVLDKDPALSVYPNPNAGNFSVRLQNASHITIYNLLGDVVLEQSLPEGTHRLSISEAGSGVYFIKATENNKSHLVKIIRQ